MKIQHKTVHAGAGYMHSLVIACMYIFPGNGGCGVDSAISYPVYLEYITGDTSYLLSVLRYKVYFRTECIMKYHISFG